jgi:hypothetical protein
VGDAGDAIHLDYGSLMFRRVRWELVDVFDGEQQ